MYGASEGLDVLMLETSSPGGQAGSSSKIENYLGFPTGISGQEIQQGRTIRRRSSARRCSSPRPHDLSATANRMSSNSRTEAPIPARWSCDCNRGGVSKTTIGEPVAFPVRELPAGDEGGAEGLDELDLLLQRLRLVERPGHPRVQVLEARVDRVLQERRIALLVAADDEPLGLDPVRSGPPLPGHAMRPTRTQPLCPPRPMAFDSATSTCTFRASFGT